MSWYVNAKIVKEILSRMRWRLGRKLGAVDGRHQLERLFFGGAGASTEALSDYRSFAEFWKSSSIFALVGLIGRR